ncbi:MAG: DUF104 domain-containing protein [Ignavibacteriae bacterium]|nr:DUF104 domain-containing protein [Ignavibacteriota bacterium]
MQTVEAIFENNVLRPLTPVEGLRNHQRVELTIHVPTRKKQLRELVGTLSKDEGEAMSNLIDREFEAIEEE